MARKTFSIRTEPHVAEVGDVELLFRPEVMGAEWLDTFSRLQDAQKRADPTNTSTEDVRVLNEATREFLAELMLPESADGFRQMPLPDRVLLELVEWVVELYGGGSGGDRPTGPSSDSASRSQIPSTRGMGNSRSRASTPARGR